MPKFIRNSFAFFAGTVLLISTSPSANSIPDGINQPIDLFQVRIDVHEKTMMGHTIGVVITTDCDLNRFRKIDLKISFYDDEALTLKEVIPGGRLYQAGWKSFSYEKSSDTLPGSSRSLPIVDISAFPDSSDNLLPVNEHDQNPKSLATLSFYVTNNRTYEGMYMPIRFFWTECSDCQFTLKNIGLRAVARSIEDSIIKRHVSRGDSGIPIEPGNSLSSAKCGDLASPGTEPVIDFFNGGIEICCHYWMDVLGDLNVNGVMRENIDADLFASYFVSGLPTFGNHPEASTATSDIDEDGVALELKDLQLMIRMMPGDTLVSAHPVDSSPVQIAARHRKDRLILESSGQDSIGLALFTLTGAPPGTIPTAGTGVGKMNMIYGQSADTLKILIYAIDKLWIEPGISELVRIPYSKSLRLESAKLVDYWGGYIRTVIAGRIAKKR